MRAEAVSVSLALARFSSSWRCTSASSARTIFSAGTRRRFLTRPSLERVQMIHFVGIELPRLHAVSIIVLKLVMIVVVALAEGDDRHDPRVARAASG